MEVWLLCGALDEKVHFANPTEVRIEKLVTPNLWHQN